MGISEQSKGFVNNLLATASWEAIKQLWGPAVLAGIVGLWQKLKHGSLDWVAITGMFLVASVLVFLNFRKSKSVEPRGETPNKLPPRPLPKLIIHRAIFGAGPQNQVDITDDLNKKIRDGLVLMVDMTIAPKDPAVNVPKTLEIEYSYDGNRYPVITRRESPVGHMPPRLVLPEDSEIGRLSKEIERLNSKPEPHSVLSARQTKIFSFANKFQKEAGEYLRKNPRPSMNVLDHDMVKYLGDGQKWKEKVRGWYYSKFASEMQQMRHELASQGIKDEELNNSIAKMEKWEQSIEAVCEIAERLRTIAANLKEDC